MDVGSRKSGSSGNAKALSDVSEDQISECLKLVVTFVIVESDLFLNAKTNNDTQTILKHFNMAVLSFG